MYNNWINEKENQNNHVVSKPNNEIREEIKNESESDEESNVESNEETNENEGGNEILVEDKPARKMRDFEIVADDNDYFYHEYEHDPNMIERYEQENDNKGINYDLFSYDASCICNII